VVHAATPSPLHFVQVVADPIKLYPVAHADAVVAEAQIDDPAPHDVQAPEFKKYPD